jgi:hypothetical protein
MKRAFSRLALAFVVVALLHWGCGGGLGGHSGAGGISGAGGSCIVGPAGAGNSTCGRCPSWSPPDAPDGGYSPAPPDGGRLTNDKLGCPSTTCTVGNTMPAAPDDQSLGFSATDLLAATTGSGLADLTWYDGTTTTMHLQGRYDAPTVYIQRGPDVDAGGTAGAGGLVPCRQMVASGAVVTLSTDDGRLMNDDFPIVVLEGVAETGRPLLITVDAPNAVLLSSLHGGFAIPLSWQVDPGERAWLLLRVNPQSLSCSAGCPPGLPSDVAWGSTTSSCGYDGKIVAEVGAVAGGGPQTANVCTSRQIVAATWTWR